MVGPTSPMSATIDRGTRADGVLGRRAVEPMLLMG